MQNDQMTLPVLALRGKIVYPETETYFEVSRPRSLKALENAPAEFPCEEPDAPDNIEENICELPQGENNVLTEKPE